MPVLIPRPDGRGALNSGGTPGNKGGTGRPPNEFREWCDDLLNRPASRQQVEGILGNQDHPAYATMWKAVTDRAYGKPGQSVQVDATQGFAALVAAAFKK